MSSFTRIRKSAFIALSVVMLFALTVVSAFADVKWI